MIKIIEDSNVEMLMIKFKGKILFEGNYWDFNRDGETFKELFEELGHDVQLDEIDYDSWYK